MSGITPLIDTLMHQVLGRQGEVSLQRALSEQVRPVSHGEGPRPIQGDSSLDGRPAPGSLNDLRRMPGLPTGERPQPGGGAAGSPPGSTQTHFSPAARTIADVLLRFPAPAPVIRPPAPLLMGQEPPVAAAVVERLEASVRDSGLFYESHLKRWFQGDMSRQQLLREPQMQPGPRPLMLPPTAMPLQPLALSAGASLQAGAPPQTNMSAGLPLQAGASLQVSTPSAGLPPQAGVSLAGTPLQAGIPTAGIPAAEAGDSRQILPGSSLVYVSSAKPVVSSGAPSVTPAPAQVSAAPPPAGKAGSPLASREAAYERDIDSLSRRGHREIVHESLQSLVRQQLDMLVTPVIRWEGDVWAGIFMALVIQLPNRDKEQGDQQESSESDDGWRSDMRLEVPNVGAFDVSLWFYRAVLSIDLTTADSVTYQYLEKGVSTLEQRLSALDLEKVQVRARHISQEHDNDLAG